MSSLKVLERSMVPILKPEILVEPTNIVINQPFKLNATRFQLYLQYEHPVKVRLMLNSRESIMQPSAHHSARNKKSHFLTVRLSLLPLLLVTTSDYPAPFAAITSGSGNCRAPDPQSTWAACHDPTRCYHYRDRDISAPRLHADVRSSHPCYRDRRPIQRA